MSKIILDKNFITKPNISTKEPEFKPAVRKNSVSKKVNINQSFRSNKPITRIKS